MKFESQITVPEETFKAATWLLMVLALACSTCVVSSSCQTLKDATSLELEGDGQLKKGRCALDVPTLDAAITVFQECVRSDGHASICFYGLACSEFYPGKADEAQNDKESAKRWRDTAITDVQHAIGSNERMANAHALLADLYGAKISGMLCGLQFGPKANAEIERAFQLDASNALAFAVVGHKYLYAPSMFGRDLDKATDSVRKAIAFDPLNDEHYVWLAIAYRKKGDSESAEATLVQALRLNGGCVFSLYVKSGATE